MTLPRQVPRRCPACDGICSSGKYLCPGCWFLLTADARRALSKRDSRAAGRLQELLTQLRDGTPLDAVGISP